MTPELLTAGPKILKKEPLTVTATLKPTAKWSDGRQITGADFLATYKTIMNPNWDIVSREGWEDIAKIKVQGKKYTVTFDPARGVLQLGVHPGRPASARTQGGRPGLQQLWSNSIDISSGAFKFGSWQKGTQLTMLRNPAFKGPRG